MFNKLVCMGRLTRDLEMITTAGGTVIANGSIAMSEKVKGEEKTVFLDVTFFGKTAEIVSEYFKKGDPILLDGKLSQDNWEKDGKRYSKLKMIANGFSFIPRTNDNGTGASSAGQSKAEDEDPNAFHDEFPKDEEETIF